MPPAGAKHITSAASRVPLTAKAAVLGDRGAFAQAHEHFEEAANILQGADREVLASLHAWRSSVFLWQGCWQQAREAAMQARRVAKRELAAARSQVACAPA